MCHSEEGGLKHFKPFSVPLKSDKTFWQLSESSDVHVYSRSNGMQGDLEV